MTEPYLPEWATADEAGDWLKAATGQEWPLPRLLASGIAMSIWIECADDQEQHIVDHVFLGRREGFRAPVVFASDIERLAFVRDGGTLSITQRRDGTPLRITPPHRFPATELFFSAADVRKIPPALEQGKLSTDSRHLVMKIGDVTITAEDPHVAQWLELNGGLEALAGAKIELVEFAAPLEPAAAPIPADIPKPSAPTAIQRDGPPPLLTSDLACAFAGLHWSEPEWKQSLAKDRQWLKVCRTDQGRRGVIESRWDPVLLGAALVGKGHAKVNSVRARFQTNHLLRPWLDAWKEYEAEYLDEA